LTNYKRLICDVLLAESEIQSFFYGKKKLSAQEFGYLPNFYVNTQILKHFLFGWVLHVLKLLWPFILIFFNIYIFVFYLFKKVMLPNAKVVSYESSRVLFASSDIAINVYNKAMPAKKCIVIFRPGKACLNKRGIHSSFDALQIIGVWKLVVVLLRSTYISLILGYNSKFSKFRFLNFYIFELLVIYEALASLNNSCGEKELFITDHYDRWALMANALREAEYSYLAIVQHGILAVAESVFEIVVPKKLSSIDCLYYFDDLSKNVFINEVFLASAYPRFIKFENDVDFSILDVDSPSILIVGCPLSFDFHVTLTNYIAFNVRKVKIYYKPHPTSADYGRYENKHWIWIDDSNYFPSVDLVISYPSSLAVQYQSANIPVFIHEIDEASSHVQAAYAQIYSKLESVL
jgi:hypothetical protein